MLTYLIELYLAVQRPATKTQMEGMGGINLRSADLGDSAFRGGLRFKGALFVRIAVHECQQDPPIREAADAKSECVREDVATARISVTSE